MSDANGVESARGAIARAESAARMERWRDALEAYAHAGRLANRNGDGAAARADALRGAAIVRMRLGEWHEAIRDVAEARLIAGRMGDERRVAKAENARGAIEFERGNWDEAERRYTASRALAASIEDVPLLMEIENNEGALWAARGDTARAEEHFRRALKSSQELERYHPCGARVLNNLGMVLAADRRLDEAEDAYERALNECKRTSDMLLATTIMINRARLAIEREEPLRAHMLATTAQIFAERLDHPLAADAACLLGAVARSERRWTEAEWHLTVALARCAEGKAPLAEAEVWQELGRLHEDQANFDDAVDALSRARRCYLGLGSEAEAERLEGRIVGLAEQVGVRV